MKKTAVLVICLFMMLLLAVSACAKTILTSVHTVTIVDEVEDVTREEVLERVAREAKEAVKEDPKLVDSLSTVTQTATEDTPVIIPNSGIKGGSLLTSVRSNLIN